MHSEQTELHLQHMIERAQMGMQGEEKEIEELLFDEVYTLVYTIYKDKEKTQKEVRTILEKYVANLSERKILDVHKNVQVYAIVRIYQALGKKNGTLYTAAENMKAYEYTVIADDSEFEKIADTYADAFESVHAYKGKPEAFQNLKAEKMIMAALYMYEKCTVNEISRTLKIDESIVKNEIAQLKECMLKIGKSMAVKEKRSQEKVQMRKKHEKTHPGDEQDEKGLVDYLLPNLGKGARTAIDIAASVVVIAAYFVIFH